MKILALDQSLRRSGWAVVDRHGNGLSHGWFGASGVDMRARVDGFKWHVEQLILDCEPAVLAWERPATFRSQRANLAGARLDEALVALAAKHELTTMTVAASTWRSQVLGKGAGRLTSDEAKALALRYCRWIGVEVRDHNAAEAVCIGRWAAAERMVMA